MTDTACGTRRSYRAGCHCDACRRAEADYAAHRNRQLAYGRWNAFTDAAPVREHIQMLQRFGLGRRRIAQLADVSERTLGNLLYGSHGTGPNQKIRPEIAAKILAVRPRLDDVHDRILIDGTGTRRRLRALIAAGWTASHLADRLGIHRGQASRILLRDGQPVMARTARAVIALYDELWDADPYAVGVPAWACHRAGRLAAQRGWPPPAAWDDDSIDDPAAQPDPGAHARRQDALAEDARFITETTGASLDLVAQRLGITRNYLDKTLERATTTA